MPKKFTNSYSKTDSISKSVREPLASASSGPDLPRASLFMNGRSQAVRLPKEFRFDGDHVFVKRDGDRVILMPHDDRMERLLAAFGSAPDFPDRDGGVPQERPDLDAFYK